MPRNIPCRNFHLTLISASNLPIVQEHFKKMKVYAKVCFNDYTETKKKTPVDKENENYPAWNHRMDYTIAETGMKYDGLMLVVKLYAKRNFGDRYIGEVRRSVKDLFDNASEQGFSANLSLQLTRGTSVPIEDAMLNISYRLGEAIMKKQKSSWKQTLGSGAIIELQFEKEVEVPIFRVPDDITIWERY